MRGEFETRLLVIERGLGTLEVGVFDVANRVRKLNQQVREAGMLGLPFAAGTITVTVLDSLTSAPISGATVTATDGVITVDVKTTNGSGVAVLTIFSTDALNVTASKSGYASKTVPITPVLDNSNTLTISLDGILTCTDCNFAKRAYTLNFTYYTNAGHTTTNSTTQTLAWDIPSQSARATFTLSDYYDQFAFPISGHLFELLCSSGHVNIRHTIHLSGSTDVAHAYLMNAITSPSTFTCTPFAAHVVAPDVVFADKVIDLS